MTVLRFISLSCDAITKDLGNGVGLLCDAESPPEVTETEARKVARKEGWQVGHNRAAYDRCPDHLNADCRPLSWRPS